jgi:hypothetical protein
MGARGWEASLRLGRGRGQEVARGSVTIVDERRLRCARGGRG